MSQEEEEQFDRLDQASIGFWEDQESANRYRICLAEVSSKNINRKDSLDWTSLTYAIWRYSGSPHETETLKYLLGPLIVHEDHSHLRLDITIWQCRTPYMVPHKANGYTAMDILEFRTLDSCPYLGSRLPEKHYQIARGLLQEAIDRISTYPSRLSQRLNEVCSSYFPIVALYSIVVDYIVWK
jgi:hypothetical protein